MNRYLNVKYLTSSNFSSHILGWLEYKRFNLRASFEKLKYGKDYERVLKQRVEFLGACYTLGSGNNPLKSSL